MSAQNIENFLPPIQSDGLNTAKAASFSGGVNMNQAVLDLTTIATLTTAQSGSLVLFDSATGFQVTLPKPAAGLFFEFVVAKRPTSGTHGFVCSSGNLAGAVTSSGNQLNGVSTSATFIADGVSNTLVSMNGTTTGGSVGTVILATGVSSSLWVISGQVYGSGVLATPIV